MSAQTIDKKLLKSALLELFEERQDLFKGLLREILEENEIIISKAQAKRRMRLDRIIEEDKELLEKLAQ